MSSKLGSIFKRLTGKSDPEPTDEVVFISTPGLDPEKFINMEIRDALSQRLNDAADKLSAFESMKSSSNFEEFKTQYQTTNARRFKFVGKMSWAWQVENDLEHDEINALLRANGRAVAEAEKLALKLFTVVAERAGGAGYHDPYIDVEGADIALNDIPYSPYTEQGAAFFTALAYSWRNMAQQWNEMEESRTTLEVTKAPIVSHEEIPRTGLAKIALALANNELKRTL